MISLINILGASYKLDTFENEKLIFKVLKRGEKLKLETAKEEADLVDGGLRYDLTVPLARYYSNHANELPSPFKAMQIGNVWRADRPQRGRFRQFVQCDIDILGEPSNLAEIELILATTTMLGKLGFKNFTVCINDRNILKAMAAYCGFKEADYEEVFIILDKMDKIGAEGVAKELVELGYAQESVDTYLGLFDEVAEDVVEPTDNTSTVSKPKTVEKENKDDMGLDQEIKINKYNFNL